MLFYGYITFHESLPKMCLMRMCRYFSDTPRRKFLSHFGAGYIRLTQLQLLVVVMVKGYANLPSRSRTAEIAPWAAHLLLFVFIDRSLTGLEMV